MKEFWLLAFFCLVSVKLIGQVDTTFIYNTNTPYGTLDIRLAKSSTRYYYLQENSTFSYRESSPGVRSNTYVDMTAWDSSPYSEGHLREKNGSEDHFVMNYRLLKPEGYNASYAKGYPLIIMFHGAGERGNCWKSKCHHATPAYDPNVNDPPAPSAPDHELLNNDHNLLHGGKFYLDAVKMAGTKLPNDGSLPIGAFPGFILFPQSLNGWDGDSSQDAIRILRLLIKRYNIDENRIYITGLSNGGHGAYQAIKRAPWLFAAGIMMSPIDDGFITSVNLQSTTANIPLWVFQGALDENPLPNETKNYIKKFRDAGAVVRYTEYPDVGHTTWNRAFKEPDYIEWLLGENRQAVHIFGGNASICGSQGLQLEMPQGFYAYQWEKDGQVISDANGAKYNATVAGSYRGRFSRISSTPSESDWNEWSPAVQVTSTSAPVAEIEQVGTVLLKDLNGGNDAVLRAKGDHAHYYWYKNGSLLNLPGDQDDTVKTLIIKPGNCGTGTCPGNGKYTLAVANFGNCKSPQTAAKYVFFNDQAPINLNAPSAFAGISQTASTVKLTWQDNDSNENGFEIWRRQQLGDNQYSSWVMPGLTTANVNTFTDVKLIPSATYQYKIRAVSNSGRSQYSPAEGSVVQVTTIVDSQAPSAPTNVKIKRVGIDKIVVYWDAATDDSAIGHYKISYGGTTFTTESADTTFLAADLELNATYAFTVSAIDLSGNEGPASAPLNFDNSITGLYYQHSPGYWGPSLDSVNYTSPEYTGFVQEFTLSPKTQEDYFYFRFEGYLYVTNGGAYEFRTTSDDGSRLILNGAEIVDNDGIHELSAKASGVQTLSEGAHRLTVDFFDYVESDSLTVEYKGPDTNGEWQVVRAAVLKSSPVTATEPTSARPVKFTVYPNPTDQGNINIAVETLGSGPLSIMLIDARGQRLYSDEFRPEDVRESIRLNQETKLTPGLYIIRIQQGKTLVQEKLIIRN